MSHQTWMWFKSKRIVLSYQLAKVLLPVFCALFLAQDVYALGVDPRNAQKSVAEFPKSNGPLPSELAFRWPVPSRAKVTETMVKKGKRDPRPVTMKYDMIVAIPPDSGDIKVAFKDFDMVSIEGVDITSPEAKKSLEKAIALFSALPSYQISSDGELLGLVGFDEMMERLLNSDLLGKDDAKNKQLVEFMKNPMVEKLIRDQAEQRWTYWVETWIGTPTDSECVCDIDYESEFLGVSVPAKGMIEPLQTPAVDGDGVIHLRFSVQYDSGALLKGVQAFFRALKLPPVDKNGKKTEDAIASINEKNFSVEKKMFLEFHGDARTLRPIRVKTETSTKFNTILEDVAKAVPPDAFERHEYVFDWKP